MNSLHLDPSLIKNLDKTTKEYLESHTYNALQNNESSCYQLFGGKALEQYYPEIKSQDYDLRISSTPKCQDFAFELQSSLESQIPSPIKITTWNHPNQSTVRICMENPDASDDKEKLGCFIDLHHEGNFPIKSTVQNGLHLAPVKSLVSDIKSMKRRREKHHKYFKKLEKEVKKRKLNKDLLTTSNTIDQCLQKFNESSSSNHININFHKMSDICLISEYLKAQKREERHKIRQEKNEKRLKIIKKESF